MKTMELGAWMFVHALGSSTSMNTHTHTHNFPSNLHFDQSRSIQSSYNIYIHSTHTHRHTQSLTAVIYHT